MVTKLPVFINLSLDQVTFHSKDIQSPVDIMFLIRRRLQEIHGCPVRSGLTAEFQDSYVNQIGQDCVDIIVEVVFIPDFSTNTVKAQLIINRLWGRDIPL